MVRTTLRALIVVGFAVMFVGPYFRLRNEGFGDAPGPVDVSQFWQGVSYVLMPWGAGVALTAAVMLWLTEPALTHWRALRRVRIAG